MGRLLRVRVTERTAHPRARTGAEFWHVVFFRGPPRCWREKSRFNSSISATGSESNRAISIRASRCSALRRRWSRRKRPGVTPTKRWKVRVKAAWSPKPAWLAMSTSGRSERQQLLRELDAAFLEPAMAAHGEAGLERACEVADGETARTREIRQPDGPVEVRAQELERELALPRA